MNEYQKELAKMLEQLYVKTSSISKNNPSLFPALFSQDGKQNDPETEMLISSFAYNMAQMKIHFSKKSIEQKNNDLSNFLGEWFEPITSSVILKASFTENNNDHENTIPEKTNFFYNNKLLNNNITFSNEIPTVINNINVVSSCFKKVNNEYSLFLEIKALKNIEKIKILKFFFDYNRFSNFYRFLDELILTQKKIKIQKDNNCYYSCNKRKIIKYSFTNMFDLNTFKKGNYTYFMHQFVNYLNNYTFIDIDFSEFNISLLENETLKIEIPLSEYISEFDDLTNFTYLNCFTVKNTYIKQGDPLILKKDKTGFFTLERGAKKNFIDIEKIVFFDKNNNNINLVENIDYLIYKKYLVTKNNLDIIFYLKIMSRLKLDTIMVPYFKCTNFGTACSIPIFSNFKIKTNNSLNFTNLNSPSKISFYFEDFNNEVFYRTIFQKNELLMDTNFSINNFFNILINFSNISKTYKGIMPKIIEQLVVKNEKNIKEHHTKIYQTFIENKYFAEIYINKQVYKFGGVSLIMHFIIDLLNKTSFLGFKPNIELKSG